jgi:small GTP-binding protein
MLATRTSLKAVLLGDASSGKTSLLSRWLDGTIDAHPGSTIGAAFRRVTLDLDGVQYDFNLWDTAGQEVYRSSSPIYCRHAKSGMIVFDMTSRTSFDSLDNWISILTAVPDVQYLIIGNKSDLQNQRQVSADEAARFAQEKGVEYIETSALNGANVHEAFTRMQMLACRSFSQSGDPDGPMIVDMAAQPAGEKFDCC